ncbi:PF13754 domain-containing protein [Holdemania filiformis]|uniref:PF13754 domain-containing protein n=1 Tax=Holdemania filiformis TaxID=61171 RepID=UPI00242C6060|nr:PF13754 domain-containing protein [Holdemania filiformis]
MVTRVFGRAGQYDLEFIKTSEGLWTAAVPFVESCEYVIDLYAEDEAGNISYYATYLLTFDASKLQVQAVPLQYVPTFIGQAYREEWVA